MALLFGDRHLVPIPGIIWLMAYCFQIAEWAQEAQKLYQTETPAPNLEQRFLPMYLFRRIRRIATFDPYSFNTSMEIIGGSGILDVHQAGLDNYPPLAPQKHKHVGGFPACLLTHGAFSYLGLSGAYPP